MAEVSNLHRLTENMPPNRIPSPHHEEDDDDDDVDFFPPHLNPNPYPFDFDLNHTNPSSFFDADYSTTTSFHFNFDFDDNPSALDYADPNSFFYGEEEYEEEHQQMNFVTDLFESTESQLMTEDDRDPLWDIDSGLSGVEFGFGPGLRVVGMDSESDSEEFVDDDNDNDGAGEDLGFGVGNGNGIGREDFEWEEVNERIQFDERENLNSVIHRIEELSISSSSSEGSRFGEDGVLEQENVGWEVLLAVNNLERNLVDSHEVRSLGGVEVPVVDLPEDYILEMEYDTLFGQLVESEAALKGSPPAAKSVVESLLSVVLTKEESGNGAVVCAVCKDEVAVGEKATKMPCCHLYHGECILPWLKIRNTCPVCRYELPTDDADYERRSGRGGSGDAARLAGDFEIFGPMIVISSSLSSCGLKRGF